MEAVRIKDIAQSLGLSTSTVSRALRGSYEISEETKKLVLDYAAKVNYKPNPIALSLRENRSRAIGIIVPEIANNFFANAINGIEEVAQTRGYHVMIFQTGESSEKEVTCLQNVVSRKLDGVAISLSGSSKDFSYIRELQREEFPIVFFDRVPHSFDAHKITADNFKGAFDATEHLILTGRKKIAHISSPLVLSITKERLAGYKSALEKHHMPYDENLVRFCQFDSNEIKRIIIDLIKTEKPDALFTASDRLALSSYSAVIELGIRIPEDIAFVGFTNLNVAHLLDPPLSTVTQPAEDLGKEAAIILIDLIESKGKNIPYRKKELPTKLNVRRSSGGVG
ncbi:MAG: LacI family DNA-binding transcriptional regulator [Saprospiraceae bacterium]